MPRTLPLLLAAGLALASHAAADVVVPSLVSGNATVSDYYVHSASLSKGVDGALHQRQLLCTECYLDLTVASGGLVVRQGATQTPLTPGVWHVWEFTGSLAYDKVGPETWRFHLDGEGIVRYAGPA